MLGGVLLGVPLVSADVTVQVALIPYGLTLLSAVGVILVLRHRHRQQLTLRPALLSMVVWSVVGVPVLAIGSHLLPYLLEAGDEYSQAAIVLLCIGLMLNGVWIAPLIALVVAAGVGIGNRKATAL